MPAALDALQAAANTDDAARAAANAADAADTARPAGITVRQRVWPMVEMLRRAHAAKTPVVWGV
jgi:Domain of unknown function (DUF1840)